MTKTAPAPKGEKTRMISAIIARATDGVAAKNGTVEIRQSAIEGHYLWKHRSRKDADPLSRDALEKRLNAYKAEALAEFTVFGTADERRDAIEANDAAARERHGVPSPDEKAADAAKRRKANGNGATPRRKATPKDALLKGERSRDVSKKYGLVSVFRLDEMAKGHAIRKAAPEGMKWAEKNHYLDETVYSKTYAGLTPAISHWEDAYAAKRQAEEAASE